MEIIIPIYKFHKARLHFQNLFATFLKTPIEPLAV